MRFSFFQALMAGAVALGAFAALSQPAQAQQAAARPLPQTMAPVEKPAPAAAARPQAGDRGQVVVTMVRARDLVTPAERQAYRQAMREARDPAAKQRVREQMMERISQRAHEHGVVVVIDAPMMRQEGRPEMRAGAESRHPAPRPAEVSVRPPPPRAP